MCVFAPAAEQEGLAGSSCRCLRKIVDRQSRWRPRELQFEQMEVGVVMWGSSNIWCWRCNRFMYIQDISGRLAVHNFCVGCVPKRFQDILDGIHPNLETKILSLTQFSFFWWRECSPIQGSSHHQDYHICFCRWSRILFTFFCRKIPGKPANSCRQLTPWNRNHENKLQTFINLPTFRCSTFQHLPGSTATLGSTCDGALDAVPHIWAVKNSP